MSQGLSALESAEHILSPDRRYTIDRSVLMRKMRVQDGMLIALLCTVLSACNEDGTGDSASPQENESPPVAGSPSPAPATNSPPSITGTPPTSVTAGTAYRFQPVTTDPNGDTLSYNIAGKPAWATFSKTSGALTGTPNAAQAGAYSNVVITVSDGRVSTALAAFSITVIQPGSGVGSATLSWSAPTQNTDGSAITGLGGYVIYHGLDPNALTNTVRVANPGITTYVIDNLPAGTHYFALAAFTTAGVESGLSAVGSKQIL
jgi:hypothetical protein